MADCLDELTLVSRAVLAVSGQLPVGQVLQVIVDSARTLAGARYAALGVPGEGGSFAEFIVSGLSAAEQRGISAPRPQHRTRGELLRGAAGGGAAAGRRHPPRPPVRGGPAAGAPADGRVPRRARARRRPA